MKFIFNKVYYVPEPRKTYAELKEIAFTVPVDTNSIVFIGDSHIQNLNPDKIFPGKPIVNLGIGGSSEFSKYLVYAVTRFSETSIAYVFNCCPHCRPGIAV